MPRTLIFKRFFKALKRDASAVEMVEAMHECGMTPQFLETLPEAVLVPLQDAMSLCQPHPPSSWSDDLLELVKRSDISLVLAPGKRSRPAMSNIIVSSPLLPPRAAGLTDLGPDPRSQLGLQAALPER
jgi:anaphase-promoting complex subunit 1